MIKFIVLAEERSGSTYLRLWLNNHHSIRCHDEVFKRIGPKDPDGFEYYMAATRWRKLIHKSFSQQRFSRYSWFPLIKPFIRNFLNDLYNNPLFSAPWSSLTDRLKYKSIGTDKEVKAVGFKLVYKHIFSYRYLEKYIKENDILVIHLTRQNLLAQATSFYRAVEHKEFHSEHNVKEKNKPFTVDPATIIGYMDEAMYWRNKINVLFNNCKKVNITYEDFFFNNPTKTKRFILDFIGISDDSSGESPKLKKLTAMNLEEVILNYEELKASLSKHGYYSDSWKGNN